jgi:hypothetical protein
MIIFTTLHQIRIELATGTTMAATRNNWRAIRPYRSNGTEIAVFAPYIILPKVQSSKILSIYLFLILHLGHQLALMMILNT